MGASEEPNDEAGAATTEGRAAGGHAGQRPDDARHLPLFLRDGAEGRKGDAQDEKDEVGE